MQLTITNLDRKTTDDRFNADSSAASFTAYADLTEAIVKGWITTKHPSIQESLTGLHNSQVNLLSQGMPWETYVEVP